MESINTTITIETTTLNISLNFIIRYKDTILFAG